MSLRILDVSTVSCKIWNESLYMERAISLRMTVFSKPMPDQAMVSVI